MLAIRAGGTGLLARDAGGVEDGEFSSDVSTPLLYQDKLFVLDGGPCAS